ncbi:MULTISPECIES: hypothetical protein [Rhizobium/Agrobacterium group]|jgi:hypothetical protein|uniref:hypothetical protein n=1 Tax=Rhizobium/Agrobacterium group TaxID=227290 RepID=UPI000714C11E|nr:hypothetical protein [Rhizobium sp. Root483D2]KQY31889.1 hypothetical protein ASD32_04705 [Rhizobium sp. Root483D2]
MSFHTRTAVIALLAAGLLPSVATASSDDAWDAMRADVSAKCLKAAAGSIEKPRAAVDPFGSESFGLALVSGKPKGAKGKITQICVYNKQTKTVELGGELTEDMLKAKAK